MQQSSTTTRPQFWEDDLSAEASARRAQQVQPRAGRAQAALPLDAADGEETALPEWGQRVLRREDAQRRPWWRPASSFGRALLVLGGLLAAGGVTAGALWLRASLERDNRFRIAGTANIQATGLNEVSRASLLPVFGEDIGKNIFFIHLNDRRRELEQIPWVQHATVMRVLPDQIRVSVVERKPVAFTQIGGATGLVDAEGVLLTMPAGTMAERHYSFPAVTGLNPADKPEARKARMGVYMRMMSELDAGGQRNSEQISEVDLSDAEDARVRMADQGGDIVAHLGEDRFLERYQRYMKHIAEWRQQYPRLTGVDLRYDRQVVLQMAPAGTAMPGDTAAQPPAQNAQGAAPAQAQTPPAVKSAAGAATAQAAKLQAAGGKADRAGNGKTGNGKAKIEKTRAERTKAEKARAERARIEKMRLEQQRRHELERRAALHAARQKTVLAAQPAAPLVEGQ